MTRREESPARENDPVDTVYSALQVRRQLQRMLASTCLRGAARRRQFLEYIVEETVAGRGPGLNQQTIARDVMGRGEDFDPTVDTSVRSEAKRLRRTISRYYEAEGKEDLIRIHLPAGTYAPVFTRNRSVRDPLWAEPEPPRAKPGSVAAPAGAPSLAVLEFDDFSEGDTRSHLAAAVTERVLVELSHRRDLYIVGPVSSQTASDHPVDPGAVARRWGVRFVLGGSIQICESLRATASVWDGANGRLLWGETFDRPFDAGGLLAIEDTVASDIVPRITDDFGLIARTLATDPGRTRRSPSDAAIAFYRAASTPTAEALKASVASMERIHKRHPAHATCAAILAALYAIEYYAGHDGEAALDRSEELARRSVGLDPACQHAQLIVAYVHFLRLQRTACLESIDQALELDPNQPTVLGFGSLLLSMVGEYERAESLNERARRLNPSYPSVYNAAPFIIHFVRGEYESALVDAEHHAMPGVYLDPLYRAAALGALDQPEAAQSALRELQSVCPRLADRWSDLLHRALFLDEHVEGICGGLAKAGLVLKRSVVG